MTPYITFAGFSGSGKTTLATKVIAYLAEKGYRIAAMKHDGHKFQMDKEGKDTYRLKEAGAKCIAISSSEKYAMISESEHRLSFKELMKILPENMDIIIGEGFKDNDVPKIVVHRKSNGKERACSEDKFVIAAATDEPEQFNDVEMVFDINDYEKIALFIENKFLKK